MEGTTIGDYRIERMLGRGGFGVVYVGVDVRLDRRAAIKQLLPELSTQRDIVERFFNEAKAAAGINHPGIVEIYDVGWHTDGSAYFAMKLLEGDSLARRLRDRRTLPPPIAATIGRQIASALAAAHARGIVHRDLKPDNVILVRDDEVSIGERATVLDFGIAKLFGDTALSARTATGMMMGTPSYMSPEQCRGAGEVDKRTDVYALGCILYELLTGRPPFVGEGLGEVLGKHQFVEPPPIRELRADLAAGLAEVVMRTLAKKPVDRFQDMAELITALQPFTGSRSAAHAVEPEPAASVPVIPAVAPTVPPTLLPDAPPADAPAGSSDATARGSDAPRDSTAPRETSPDATEAARSIDTASTSGKRPRAIWFGVGGLVAAGAITAIVASGSGGARDADAPRDAGGAVGTTAATAPPDAGEAPVALGQRLFASKGCISCHTVDGTRKAGASMKGAWGTTIELADGGRRVFDVAFLRDSLREPQRFVRPGYSATMPSYDGQLTPIEVDALAAYVASLGVAIAATPATTAADGSAGSATASRPLAETGAPSPPVNPARVRPLSCEPLLRARAWSDLAACARELAASDGAAAKRYAERARLELDGEAAARPFRQALAAGQLASAAKLLAAVPARSAARAAAKAAYDRAVREAASRVVTELTALDRSNDCTAYRARLDRAERELGPAVASTARARVACPVTPARVVGTPSSMRIMEQVHFAAGSAKLPPAGRRVLDAVALTIRSSTELSLEIQGHTSSRGSDGDNLALSRRRAEEVRMYLIARGVDASRMVARGYGEDQPIADNATAAGRAANDRVEFRVRSN